MAVEPLVDREGSDVDECALSARPRPSSLATRDAGALRRDRRCKRGERGGCGSRPALRRRRCGGHRPRVRVDVGENAFQVLDDGTVMLAAAKGSSASVVRVRPDGTSDPLFAAFAPTPANFVAALDVDGLGRVVTAETSGTAVIVRRLLPTCQPDVTFDVDGELLLPAPQIVGAVADIDVDDRGRIAVLYGQRTAALPGEECVVTGRLGTGRADRTKADGRAVGHQRAGVAYNSVRRRAQPQLRRAVRRHRPRSSSSTRHTTKPARRLRLSRSGSGSGLNSRMIRRHRRASLLDEIGRRSSGGCT